LISPDHYSNFSSSRIKSFFPLSGGDISDAFRLDLDDGSNLFLKKNSSDKFPGMFEAEAKGLHLLGAATSFVPRVISVVEENDEQFLLLEHLETGILAPSDWRSAGKELSKIHRKTSALFGLDHSNYMGSLTQYNHQCSSFSEFFVTSRLGVQVKLARDARFLEAAHIRQFERFYLRLEELIPAEKPSLVHGDLWTGNLHESKKGGYFIDPAVAFSHREVDLAMSMLFGSFPGDFYMGYTEDFPLEKDWKARIQFFNLYPLLVHLNLFGLSYQPRIAEIINRF